MNLKINTKGVLYYNAGKDENRKPKSNQWGPEPWTKTNGKGARAQKKKVKKRRQHTHSHEPSHPLHRLFPQGKCNHCDQGMITTGKVSMESPRAIVKAHMIITT